jgi:hypothetical protein
MTTRAPSLAGQRFGRLVAVEVSPRKCSKSRTTFWVCRCDCGAERHVRRYSLLCGETKSCGCLHREIARAAGDRTRTHGRSKSSMYAIWDSMRQRCLNPKNGDYQNYGGRGITVCEQWASFECFVADMGERPDGMTLNRIDNDGPYSKENCEWATTKAQARNTRATRTLTMKGRSMPMVAWAEELGMSYNTLSARLRRGWPVSVALTAPIDARFSHV